ncbi:hypothetical protein BDF14DRAFT_1822827 [Spinellus fusiger]|nr:hypothetical protein BDF14DRAFT_1822827 [Spinellus fusiger]
MQPIVLYNFSLLDHPNELWSANPFKTHYTLVFKNLPFTTEWLEFHEISQVIPTITKTKIPPTVPVIVDTNNTVIQDSWEIAKYLESAYPDSPSVFNGAESLHHFFYQYYQTNIQASIYGLVAMNVKKHCGHYDNPNGFSQKRHVILAFL